MVLKPILGTNSKSHLSLLSAQPNKPRRNQDRLKDRRHPTVVIHRKNLRSLSMESSSSSSSSTYSLSYWDYVTLFLLRPVLAIVFVLSLISLGWWLAWKLVLVHVPLVQEIFGLRKKQIKPKRPARMLTKIYSSMNARNSAS